MKEYDRLALAKTMMDRKLERRRLVMAKPLVPAGMVAKTLKVTPQGGAADRFGAGPSGDDREGRFRVWGVL